VPPSSCRPTLGAPASPAGVAVGPQVCQVQFSPVNQSCPCAGPRTEPSAKQNCTTPGCLALEGRGQRRVLAVAGRPVQVGKAPTPIQEPRLTRRLVPRRRSFPPAAGCCSSRPGCAPATPASVGEDSSYRDHAWQVPRPPRPPQPRSWPARGPSGCPARGVPRLRYVVVRVRGDGGLVVEEVESHRRTARRGVRARLSEMHSNVLNPRLRRRQFVGLLYPGGPSRADRNRLVIAGTVVCSK